MLFLALACGILLATSVIELGIIGYYQCHFRRLRKQVKDAIGQTEQALEQLDALVREHEGAWEGPYK